jgi:hypothetical protein
MSTSISDEQAVAGGTPRHVAVIIKNKKRMEE